MFRRGIRKRKKKIYKFYRRFSGLVESEFYAWRTMVSPELRKALREFGFEYEELKE